MENKKILILDNKENILIKKNQLPYLKELKLKIENSSIKINNSSYKIKEENEIIILETNLNSKEILNELPSYNFELISKNNLKEIKDEKLISNYFFHLKNYTIKSSQDIGISIDLVILTIENEILKVLLTHRNKEPFLNHYTLPGGFIKHDISLQENAKNILKKNTNISNVYLEQLFTFGEVQRDPRGRILSITYYALIDSKKNDLVTSKKYDEIKWFNLTELKKQKIGFDHKKIIDLAIERIKNKVEYTNIAFQLLPEKFTLAELQKVYEVILEKELDKRNFRKKIAELDMVEELNEFKKEGRMRPAKYHQFKERTKETPLKAKKWI